MQLVDPVETLGGCLQPVQGNPVWPSILQIDNDAFVPFAVVDTADPMGSYPAPLFFFKLFQKIGDMYELELFHGFILSGVVRTVSDFIRN